MFSYRKFDVIIERRIDVRRLRWPAPSEAGTEAGLGGNRDYEDLRGLSWSEAQRMFALEGELIARLESAEAPDAEYDEIEEELYDDPESLIGLDIGVAAAVATLSAAKCVPVSSCNGAAFGGWHHEAYPLVAFCARKPAISLLLECAEAADAGLTNDLEGYVTVYADDVRNMRKFAETMIGRSRDFRQVRYRRARSKTAGLPRAKQLRLL